MNNSAYKYYYFDENQTFTTLENYGNNKVPKRGFIEINRLKKLESKTITKIHFFENDVIVYFDGYPHVFVDWKEMIKSGIFDKAPRLKNTIIAEYQKEKIKRHNYHQKHKRKTRKRLVQNVSRGITAGLCVLMIMGAYKSVANNISKNVDNSNDYSTESNLLVNNNILYSNYKNIYSNSC